MAFFVHLIILFRHVEFPEEVEGYDSIAVDDDGQKHHCEKQLQKIHQAMKSETLQNKNTKFRHNYCQKVYLYRLLSIYTIYR